MAQPWSKRNRDYLITGGIGVAVCCLVIALMVWANYQIPAATVQTPSVSNDTPIPSNTPVVKKQHHKTQQKKKATVHDQQPASFEMRAAEARSLKTQDTCQAAGYFWDVMHDECRSNN
jgi:hypothetical protein